MALQRVQQLTWDAGAEAGRGSESARRRSPHGTPNPPRRPCGRIHGSPQLLHPVTAPSGSPLTPVPSTSPRSHSPICVPALRPGNGVVLPTLPLQTLGLPRHLPPKLPHPPMRIPGGLLKRVQNTYSLTSGKRSQSKWVQDFYAMRLRTLPPPPSPRDPSSGTLPSAYRYHVCRPEPPAMTCEPVPPSQP